MLVINCQTKDNMTKHLHNKGINKNIALVHCNDV